MRRAAASRRRRTVTIGFGKARIGAGETRKRMVAGWVLLVVSLVYVGLLFAVAYFGDRKPLYPDAHLAASDRLQPGAGGVLLVVDVLRRGRERRHLLATTTCRSISVRCCCSCSAYGILQRLVQIAGKEHNITSIADFVAARYGKAQGLGALVTVIAVTAAVPYIALQFKAVAMSVNVLGGAAADASPRARARRYRALRGPAAGGVLDPVRHAPHRRHRTPPRHDAGDRPRIAGEAGRFRGRGIVRMAGNGRRLDLRAAEAPARPRHRRGRFPRQTLLAGLRHVLPAAPVPGRRGRMRTAATTCATARWLFPLYLVVISLLVIPIAQAGSPAVAGPERCRPTPTCCGCRCRSTPKRWR
jgi:hypothetical protein